MTISELDNPLWHSLQTRHYDIALRTTGSARFPAEYAPFLSVIDAREHPPDTITSLLEAKESVYLLGIAPKLNKAWHMQALTPLVQMICDAPLKVIAGPEIIQLSEHDHTNVMDLTARVYPYYFRNRTMELGRYFGIYQGAKLAAMIGERMGTDIHQEISAICTDPDFIGRGYARRLLAYLSNDNIDKCRMPFLHVSRKNTRALSLYESIGYRMRRNIPLWSMQRL